MNHPPNNNNVIDNAADNDAVVPAIAEVVVVGANDVAVVAGADAAAADEDQDAADVDVATLDILPPAERERIYQEAMTLLQNRFNLPTRLRDRTMVQFAQQFINNVKEDIHTMLTDTRTEEQGYDGLDSDRDTEEEVANAIRCCPEVLTRRSVRYGFYPISCLTCMVGEDNKIVCNLKAVSFVHLFARLAIEFDSFEDNTRGGLLIEDADGNNIVQCLTCSSDSSYYDEEHHQLVDTTFLAVLIQLRRLGYLVQEDIQQYDLVHQLCHGTYLAEQRFRFMTEWCPSALLRTNVYNNELPFHWGTHTIRKFRAVLDAYFRFYPRWKGINALFTIDNDGDTPFSMACELLTRTKVMEVVEEILVRYTTNNGLLNNSNNNGNAMVLAASDDNISLDGLFFLIRRQPNTMLSMLRRRNNISNRITNRNRNDPGVDSTASEENGTEGDRHNNDNTNNTDDNNNDDQGSNSNYNTVTVLPRSTRKRKRN